MAFGKNIYALQDINYSNDLYTLIYQNKEIIDKQNKKYEPTVYFSKIESISTTLNSIQERFDNNFKDKRKKLSNFIEELQKKINDTILELNNDFKKIDEFAIIIDTLVGIYDNLERYKYLVCEYQFNNFGSIYSIYSQMTYDIYSKLTYLNITTINNYVTDLIQYLNKNSEEFSKTLQKELDDLSIYIDTSIKNLSINAPASASCYIYTKDSSGWKPTQDILVGQFSAYTEQAAGLALNYNSKIQQLNKNAIICEIPIIIDTLSASEIKQIEQQIPVALTSMFNSHYFYLQNIEQKTNHDNVTFTIQPYNQVKYNIDYGISSVSGVYIDIDSSEISNPLHPLKDPEYQYEYLTAYSDTDITAYSDPVVLTAYENSALISSRTVLKTSLSTYQRQTKNLSAFNLNTQLDENNIGKYYIFYENEQDEESTDILSTYGEISAGTPISKHFYDISSNYIQNSRVEKLIPWKQDYICEKAQYICCYYQPVKNDTEYRRTDKKEIIDGIEYTIFEPNNISNDETWEVDEAKFIENTTYPFDRDAISVKYASETDLSNELITYKSIPYDNYNCNSLVLNVKNNSKNTIENTQFVCRLLLTKFRNRT